MDVGGVVGFCGNLLVIFENFVPSFRRASADICGGRLRMFVTAVSVHVCGSLLTQCPRGASADVW